MHFNLLFTLITAVCQPYVSAVSVRPRQGNSSRRAPSYRQLIRPGYSNQGPLSLSFTPTQTPYGYRGDLPASARQATSLQVQFSGFSKLAKACHYSRKIPCNVRVPRPNWGDCVRMGCCWNPLEPIQCTKAAFHVVSLRKTDFSNCGVPEVDSSVTRVVDPPFRDLALGLLLQPRIIGGQGVPLGMWPWTVFIFFRTQGFVNPAGRVCGGSLVSNKWIVTAAHCIQTPNPNLYSVLLGANDLLSLSGNEVTRNVVSLLLHPSWNPTTFDFDVAVLQLSEAVEFTKYIRPICIIPSGTRNDNNNPPSFAGATCVTVGWGALSSPTGNLSNTLQQINVTVTPETICQITTFANSVSYGNRIANTVDPATTKFCAHGLPSASTQDTCLGDSGGPLMCLNPDGKYYLHGITSYGTNICASNLPGIYTEVSAPSINSFITSNIS